MTGILHGGPVAVTGPPGSVSPVIRGGRECFPSALEFCLKQLCSAPALELQAAAGRASVPTAAQYGWSRLESSLHQNTFLHH
jgi:hypothetical protein